MRATRTTILLASLLALGTAAAGCAPAAGGAAGTPAGGAAWRSLFDGTTLAGWRNPYDWGEAWAEGGELRLRGDRKFFLVTDRPYRDFVFEGEVLLPDTMSNAGFMFRANVEKNKVYGYQAEVDPKGRRWAGGFYDEGRRAWLVPAPRDAAAARAFAEGPGRAFRPTDWNRYRIEARGDSIKIWVNEVQTVAARDTVDREGYLGIQHHGEKGKVYRYRNLRVRELGTPASRP